jgi:hypothetical protein
LGNASVAIFIMTNDKQAFLGKEERYTGFMPEKIGKEIIYSQQLDYAPDNLFAVLSSKSGLNSLVINWKK